MVGKWIVMMQGNVARIFKILQCPVPSGSAMGSPSINRNKIIVILSQLEDGITSRHFVLITSTTSFCTQLEYSTKSNFISTSSYFVCVCVSAERCSGSNCLQKWAFFGKESFPIISLKSSLFNVSHCLTTFISFPWCAVKC